MIHVTFASGNTMLFLPQESVWVCSWISNDGEYFDGYHNGNAEDVLNPGWYVIERDHEVSSSDDAFLVAELSKIVAVKEINDCPSFLNGFASHGS